MFSPDLLSTNPYKETDIMFMLIVIGAILLTRIALNLAQISSTPQMKHSNLLNLLMQNEGSSIADPFFDESEPFSMSNDLLDFSRMDMDMDMDTTNPATGLPMIGCIDTMGNLWGCSSSSFDDSFGSIGSPFDDSFGSIGSPFDDSFGSIGSMFDD
jgi:hypothetical protein